jgi:hypothetical protein
MSRYRWPIMRLELTLSGNHFIVQGIPEENMFREINLFWKISVGASQLHPADP